MDVAVAVEIDGGHLADRPARTRDVDIEDRQRAGEIAALQLTTHVLRDEEAQSQRRADRLLDSRHRADRAFAHARNGAHRLKPAQEIVRGLGKESVGVEEVRTAEHVVERVLPVRQMTLGPGANLRQLSLLERVPVRIVPSGVPLPGGIAGQRRERRAGGWRQAGQEPGVVVRVGTLRDCSAMERDDPDGAGEERDNLIDRRHVDKRHGPLPGTTFWRNSGPCTRTDENRTHS